MVQNLVHITVSLFLAACGLKDEANCSKPSTSTVIVGLHLLSSMVQSVFCVAIWCLAAVKYKFQGCLECDVRVEVVRHRPVISVRLVLIVYYLCHLLEDCAE